MEKLHLKSTKFVNDSGQQVLLHGENVLRREREDGHIYPQLIPEGLPYFGRMGFNLIRYGIFWDAVEPEPGKIDEEYLAAVKNIIREAEKRGIYVMIDMHQDLFAQKYIDGAPDWACLDEGLYHPDNCTIWFNAYLESDAIIRAVDNFWANAPAPDGVGLLDHYAAMWEHIAEVFADCPNVIGFEPMNEPFMGHIARDAFGGATIKMMEKDPSFNMTDPNIPPETAAEFMGYVAERFLEFDRTTLMDFYRRMERAVRLHSDKPLITGGNIYCSTDLPTGISRLESGNQIYAPHGYDSVVDSDRYENFSQENVIRLYQNKRKAQEQLGLPTIAAEWGAFPFAPFANDLIRQMNLILEENLWGSAYCEWRPIQTDHPYFTALCRAYPMLTAGDLRSYHYDPETGRFTMVYDAVAGGETVIFCPKKPESVQCDLPSEFRFEDRNGGLYCVLTAKKAGTACVVLK